MKTKRILVVDDDLNMQHLLNTFLSDVYQVTIVSSGADALECLRIGHYDLVLLDYLMPIMNGKDTLEMIRKEENTKNIPVFFLTGVNDSAKINECLELVPQGYILKPIGKFSLLSRIRTYFDEHELEAL